MGKDILIVDDDPDAREILDTVLSTLDIPIRQACDGVEALNCIFKDPPLLIVLDLSMPHLDGLGVLRQLRARPAAARMPVIIFTAHSLSNEQIRALGVPDSRVVYKGTLSMTELRRVVARTLYELELSWTPVQRMALVNLQQAALL